MGEPKTDPLKHSSLKFPLNKDQYEGAINGLKKRGATFFSSKQLEQLVKDNPQDVKMKDILDKIGGSQDLPEEILKK